MQESVLEGHNRPTLASLLAVLDKPQSERSPEEEQLHQFRRKMAELARGLLDSEYWELLSFILVDGLEAAKGELESEATSDQRLRVCQGAAAAYRGAYNTIIEMSKDVSEENNG